MAQNGTFATALNCMDGRCQTAAFTYVQQQTGADHIDMITEPGMDGILAGTHSVMTEDQLSGAQDWVRRKADISANGHGSKTVTIFGHCACAGNAVGMEDHVDHLKKARELVEGWDMFDTVNIVVFNDQFEIEEVD